MLQFCNLILIPHFFPESAKSAGAGRAQSLKLDSLAVYDKFPVWAFYQRWSQLPKAVGRTAAYTGKMRVTLIRRAVCSRFEMPCFVSQESLMDHTPFDQAFQNPVYCDLVGAVPAESGYYPLDGNGFAFLKKDRQYGHSRPGFPQVRSGQDSVNFLPQYSFHRLCWDFFSQ